jgi:mannose-6-phosphate isomerase-like protein (cupin superfamily)
VEQQTFSFQDSVVHIDANEISHAPNDDAYWKQRDRRELSSGYVLSVFSYTETWGYQERHPTSDELAVVLSGRIRFLIAGDDGEEAISMPEGAGCIVPSGRWHRLAVDEPCTMLFVTPAPSRTDHRNIVDDEPGRS